ncbi:MAG: acyl-CoA dehydrogenase family protein [Desulfobacterales bacterium]
MDLDLNREQKALKNSAREFLKKECPRSLLHEMKDDLRGYPQALWDKMADLGWPGLAIPEKYGGFGGRFMDVCVLLEAMGEACCPGPYYSTIVLGALPIMFAGTEKQKQTLLPEIAEGKLICAFAMMEPEAWYGPEGISFSAVEDNDVYRLNGTKLFVENAHIADYILCVARTSTGENTKSGLTIFLVNAKSSGIRSSVLNTLAYDKQCEVVFNNVTVPKDNILGDVDGAWPILQKVQDHAAVAKCADMLGAMQAVFDMTVAYAKERKQFGQPIGSFQAIQHHCANMVIDVDGARFITYFAAWELSEGQDASMDASMAKAWTGKASGRVTLLAHQIHGAIAFCEEMDVHLFYRRAKCGDITFGDSDWHLKEVARGLGLP